VAAKTTTAIHSTGRFSNQSTIPAPLTRSQGDYTPSAAAHQRATLPYVRSRHLANEHLVRPLECVRLVPAVGLVDRRRLTGEPLDQIDDHKQDHRAKCGRNNGANNASAEGQTEP
jgi:hypothetical protein